MNRRILHVTTVPESLGFIAGQPGYLRTRGWDVHAVSSPGEKLESFGTREGVTVHAVEMPRRITPARDALSVAKLTQLFRRLRPAIVHAHTPKGGLLGMMAATLAGIPVRIYHMRGLPFTTARGARRQLLQMTERTACALAHHVLCQSPSLRQEALTHHLCAAEKIRVLCGGSNGIDAAERFNPRTLGETRAQLRHALGWSDAHIAFGFVGRLVGDKGISELAEAWQHVRDQVENARLVLLGPFEAKDAVSPAIRSALERDRTVHLVGFTPETPRWYATMDVFVFPSHREGFPNAPLEASAMELPVIATTVPGCVDAVIDGSTGTLIPPRSPSALAQAMIRYAREPSLRVTHGAAGRVRVLSEFSREPIWHALDALYTSQLEQSIARPRTW